MWVVSNGGRTVTWVAADHVLEPGEVKLQIEVSEQGEPLEIPLRPTPEMIEQAFPGFTAAREREEHNATIDAQIVELEQAAGGYVRGVREMFLGQALLMKAARQAIDAAPVDSQLKALAGCFVDFTVTPGMVKIKQLDDQVKTLRAQRRP